jgi:hypothetical protein
MTTRRDFLSVGAFAGAAVLQPSLLTGQSPVSKISAVQKTTTHLLLGHLHKMSKRPTYNPFATGELAAIARLHFVHMEEAGHNNRAAVSLREAGGVTPINSSHVDGVLTGLKGLGIDFGRDAEAFLKYVLPRASEAVAPSMTRHLVEQRHGVLNVQRALHTELVKLTSTGKSKLTSYGAMSSRPRLKRVGYDETVDVYAYGGWDVMDLEMQLPGEYGGGPIYTPYIPPNDLGFAFGTKYTTPSGQEIDLCSVFYSALALGAGGWAILLGAGGAQFAFGVAFVAADPALAVVILGLAAAIATYLALVC